MKAVWLDLKELILVIKNFAEDCVRYIRFSGTFAPYKDREAFRAYLTKHYHSIEKGLSFAQPRPGFGEKPVRTLLKLVTDYCGRYGVDETAKTCLGVLAAYKSFHGDKVHPNPSLIESVDAVCQGFGDPSWLPERGGVLHTERKKILAGGALNFLEFVESRFSIRSFANGAVDEDLIRQAVRMAQKTPSVCNRQPWRVHDYGTKAVMSRILQYQNGNRGFGDTAARVLLVTCDYRAFASCTERNEAFVDGGMFSMSLVYALHSLGLGTCCLNLCQQNRTGRELRKVGGIPAEEVLIMMIAVGHLPETLRVARSERRSLSEVLVAH